MQTRWKRTVMVETFNLETDINGEVRVNAVVGRENDVYYQTDIFNKIDDEIKHRYDTKTHIYVIVADISTERVDDNCGVARFEGGPVLLPMSGGCIENEESVRLISHELGHALNLEYDFRDPSYIMSYGPVKKLKTEFSRL